MGVISGENGAVYYNAAITDTATVSSLVFSTGKTITSSTASGSTGPFIDFETKEYETGMFVTVSGCASTANNRIFTLASVSSGALTVSEAVTAASPDTGIVIFTERDPGFEIGGFFNWTVTYSGDALETSAFDDTSGGRTYIGGLTNWSGSADKYWLNSSNRVDSWMGSTGVQLRLFTKFVATPSTGSPSQYWNGNVTITGLDHNVPRDAVINRSVGFQGQGLLTLTTKTAAWNTTA